MSDFTMPSLGADMDSGTLLEWMVKPGDVVHRGDIIAVVDTAKSAVDVEVFSSGVVEELLVPPGREVPVGTPLARIREELPQPRASAAPGPHAPPEPAPPQPAEPEPPKPTPSPPAALAPLEPAVPPLLPGPAMPLTTPSQPGIRPPVISPVLRHLADRLGVDLSAVEGTGPAGTVTRHDVERAGRRRAVRPGASPYARRRAAELGVDLSAVTGSGPDGAIRVRDVLSAAAARSAARPAPDRPAATVPRIPDASEAGRPATSVPGLPLAAGSGPTAGSGAPADAAAPRRGASGADRLMAMRQATAALMARSKREIPHFYLTSTVDVSAAQDWLRGTNESRPVGERLLFAALALRAVVLATADYPELNGHWRDGAFRPADGTHLGVAVSLRGGGLVAPAIRDADRLGLDELMARLRDVSRRARVGTLRSSEMSEPSITVTNLGDQGVDSVHGVIYPPQVALVGVGRVADRPWAVDGLLGVRPLVTLTLAADHRAADGHRGGLFLAAVARHLDSPEEL